MKISILLVFLFIGSISFAQGDYELLFVKGEYNVILEKSQKLESPDDYFWNSIILDRQGRTLDAVEVLQTGIAELDTISMLEKLLADCLYKTGQYAEAKALLEEYSDDKELFLKYINVLEYQREYAQAIELLKRNWLSDSTQLDYLALLGDNYLQVDSLELALGVYSRLFSINPNDQLTATKLAKLLHKIEAYKMVVEVCDRGLRNDTTNKRLIKLKGMASFNLRDFQTAESCFNYVYEQGDSSKLVVKNLGISKFNNSSFAEALLLLLKAFKLDTTDFETCFMLGRCYLNSPEPEVGLYYLDRVDSLLQPDPHILATVYVEKQSIYSTLNRPDQALICYQKAYEYEPRTQYIFYMASICQHDLNEPQAALEHYEKFLSLLPEDTGEAKTEIKGGKVFVSLKTVAEQQIVVLKEELFFKDESE